MSDLAARFPNLVAHGHEITSDQTRDYNCVAWAAGENDRWWEPLPGYYWPKDAKRTSAVIGAIEAFRSKGYDFCRSRDLESGTEKVAIYAVGGSYSHVARQMESGAWTSKIGALEDIRHDTLEALEGDAYGKVVYVMSRTKKP